MFHRRCVLDLQDKDHRPLVEEVHWGPKAKVWKVVHEVLGPHCKGLPGPDELRETLNIHTRG